MNLSRTLVRLLPILAPALILILIAIYGVNVPYYDEWSHPGQFLIAEKHTFADYFAQANESRIIIPRAIFQTVSKFAGWQPKHYMFLGWGIVLVIFSLIYKACYCRLTHGREQDWTGLLCIALSSFLLFSPAAFDNWLWGIQWVIFVPLLCVLMAFHIQNRVQSFTVRFAATVLLNAVAMFTFANGILVWIISFPFWKDGIRWIAGRRGSNARTPRLFLWSLLYLLTASFFIWIYFRDYQKIGAHPSMIQALKEPWNMLKYLAAWCGAPFHSPTPLRIILGFAYISLGLFVVYRIVKRVREQRGWRAVFYIRMLYPALLLIAFGLASGLITALGRTGFGVHQAFSSRYMFHSGALLVGLIAALNAHRLLLRNAYQQAGRENLFFRGSIVVFLIFFLRTWNHYYPWFDLTRVVRTQTLLTVRLLALVPKSPAVDKTCTWADLPVLVRTLNERNIHNTSSFGDWILDELKHPRKESAGFGRIKSAEGSQIGLMGWAVKPIENVPADAVLICRRGQSGALEPWMMIAVGFKIKRVHEIHGKPSHGRSGFMEYMKYDLMAGVPAVEMFAVDESNRHLYPISQIPREPE